MGTFLSAIFLSAIHDTATAFDVNKQERWHRIVVISIRWMRLENEAGDAPELTLQKVKVTSWP